jgi:hypothetical protein
MFAAGTMVLAEVLNGARVLRDLPAFVRSPVTLDEARVTLRARFAQRERDFLTIARRAVYEHAESPYRRLLAHAGCEYGDLERLVLGDGVEGALRELCRGGVYLTIEEFRGRRPVRRGSLELMVDPIRVRNPSSAYHLATRSSGSRGSASSTALDLAFLRESAITHLLALEAKGGRGWHHALWGVPGGAALHLLLLRAVSGAPSSRWFSQIDPADSRLSPRYRWSARLVRWAAGLGGVRLPRPEHVPVDDPFPIVRWMVDVRRAGGTPYLNAFASSVVRVCEAARAAGQDISGAQFRMTGEPTTPARLAEVKRVGAFAVPAYGSTETACWIGYGCLDPATADDLHFMHDMLAVIHPAGDAKSALPPAALLLSSVRPRAPLILLNVCLGDQAQIVSRACGCSIERLGWTQHLSSIRSYEKLTAGGMTFLDVDLIRALEEVLPARFGGGPTDYQLVEDEGDEGSPRLSLLVHPQVGPVDAGAVRDAFLSAIGDGAGVERVMSLAWRISDLVRVERRVPEHTPGGKVLHLHVTPRAAATNSGVTR